MNSILKRIATKRIKFTFNSSLRNISYINNIKDLFGTKKIPIKGSGGGVKVSNVSSKVSNKKTIKREESEEEEEPIVKYSQTKQGKPSNLVKEKNQSPSKVSPIKNKSNLQNKIKKPVIEEVKEKNPTKIKVASNIKNSVSKPVSKKVITAPSEEDVEEVSPNKKTPVKKSAGNKKTRTAPSEEDAEEVTPNKKTPVKKSEVNKKTTTAPSEDDLEEVVTPKNLSKVPRKATHTLETVPIGQPLEKKEEPTKKKVAIPKKKTETEFSITKIGKVSVDSELDPQVYTNNPHGVYEDYIEKKSTINTKGYINTEKEYLCNNYAPLPVICSRGQGIYLQDIDGINYVDFLSAYSAVNHGHLNQNIIQSAISQMQKLYMTSRAFYNNVLGEAASLVCKLFQYDKVLFMNSGVEAGESAVKIARRWGYMNKKIPSDQAKIVFANGNFWGRSLYACATSDDPSRYENFGPFDRSTHYMVNYGNFEEMKILLENDSNICAVFLEPIQGEGGVIIPPEDYLKNVSDLCRKFNVLLIMDEIQTGIGRAGYLLCSQMFKVQPDIVLLGKSLSGGLYPISAVLTSKEVMDYIKPGEHGSTYGGNPLAAQICIAALKELFNTPLIKQSYYRGIEFGLVLKEELEKNRFVKEVRGRGLMYAIEIWPDCGFSAYDFSLWLMERGILCKPTKKFILRLTPPLVISSEEIVKCAEIISKVFNMAQKLHPEFVSSEIANFNIPTTDKDYIDQFIHSRREKKAKLLEEKDNFDIKIENANPVLNLLSQIRSGDIRGVSNENIHPIDQILNNSQHQQNVIQSDNQNKNLFDEIIIEPIKH